MFSLTEGPWKVCKRLSQKFYVLIETALHNELGAHNKDSSNMLKTIDLGSNLNVLNKFKKKK